ncbi:MAG: hypothetical protein NFCOHLIN_01295 [Gammaproteobacteria bacterium]|nr:hypothetical protein [Gammaproteobacteria bacterium]
MRTLNRMLVCVATVMTTLLLPSTSFARDNVYLNFGYSSAYPATHYHRNRYPGVIHATPYYPLPVTHYRHYYSPRHYYADRCAPRGYFDAYRPRHHGRRDLHRDHWRGGDDGYHGGRHDRRGSSHIFVEKDD